MASVHWACGFVVLLSAALLNAQEPNPLPPKQDRAALEEELSELRLRLKSAEKREARILAEVDRLKEECQGLLKTLVKRGKTISTLEAENTQLLKKAIEDLTLLQLLQDRNRNLVERVRLLEVNLEPAPGIPAELRSKPPKEYVKGTIVQIDEKDHTLVKLSVGTEHGVSKGNTLEVYRTKPRPEYLGTVRIIDTVANNSVGKMMKTKFARSAVTVGDFVTSSLEPPPEKKTKKDDSR